MKRKDMIRRKQPKLVRLYPLQILTLSRETKNSLECVVGNSEDGQRKRKKKTKQ